MSSTPKATVCGVDEDYAQFSAAAEIGPRLPFALGNGVAVERLQKLSLQNAFDFWTSAGSLSSGDVKRLANWRLGIVNRFEGELNRLGEPEDRSRDLLFHAYLAAKVVRPQRYSFQFVQLTLEPEPRAVRFARPEGAAMLPDVEARSRFSLTDLERLHAIFARTHFAITAGMKPLVSALRNMEAGYSSRFPHLQQIAWCAGIEALLRAPGSGVRDLTARVKQALGGGIDPYRHASLKAGDRPTLDWEAVLSDAFRARSLFVHGSWIPDEWVERIGRREVAGPTIAYADVLREAASATLRQLLEKALSTNEELDKFSSYAAITRRFGN